MVGLKKRTPSQHNTLIPSQLVFARDVLRKYGILHTRIRRIDSAPPMFEITVLVNFSGKFRNTTLTQMLQALYDCFGFPDEVGCRVVRNGATGVRPMLTLRYFSPHARRLLEAVGWSVGRSGFDAKALAIKRHLAYRRASGSYWKDRHTPNE